MSTSWFVHCFVHGSYAGSQEYKTHQQASFDADRQREFEAGGTLFVVSQSKPETYDKPSPGIIDTAKYGSE